MIVASADANLTQNKKVAEEAKTAANNAMNSASGKNTVFHQPTEPTGEFIPRDMWFDTANGNRLSIWDGSDWAPAKFDYRALNVEQLAAISADLGNVTAGNITGVIIRGSTIYVDGNAPDFLYTNAVDVNPVSTGIHVYIRPTKTTGEVRVTETGTLDQYAPIRSSEYRNGSSIKYKTNIEDLEDDGLYVINNLQFKRYLLQKDVDGGVYDNWQVGLIAELSPEVATPDSEAINLYKLLSYNAKATQELHAKYLLSEQRADGLETTIGELTTENEALKQRLDAMEQRLINLENGA